MSPAEARLKEVPSEMTEAEWNQRSISPLLSPDRALWLDDLVDTTSRRGCRDLSIIS